MRSSRRLAPAALLVLSLLLAACTPEGSRERGGDRGGDPGNQSESVTLHSEDELMERIYYQTPSVGRGIERSDRAGAIASES